MTNDLENQSSEKSEDFLPYAFTEDAVSEEDALESVGQEDLPSGVVLVAPRTGMSALSLGEAVVETILANANWKIPLAITPNNHRLGV